MSEGKIAKLGREICIFKIKTNKQTNRHIKAQLEIEQLHLPYEFCRSY